LNSQEPALDDPIREKRSGWRLEAEQAEDDLDPVPRYSLIVITA